MFRTCRLAHLSVCVSVSVGRSVQKVYCGKTAEWIQIPFGMVSGVDRRMGVLDGAGYRRRGKGSFGVNLGRPIVNNGTLLHSCAEVREPIELSFGVVSGLGPGIMY